MNKKLLLTALSAIILGSNTQVNAQAIYVPQTGASGCIDCHLTSTGGGGWKPEVITIWQSATSQTDLITKLTAYVKSLQTTTSPDTAPVLSAVNSKWNITVGELPLAIPFNVKDAEADTFDIHGSVASGMTVSTITTNNVTNLPTFSLRWTPTALQAGKNYPLSLYVRETGSGRTLSSNTVLTAVKVWPARANAATAQVSQFSLQAAQWIGTSKTLKLSGQVLFKSTVTAAQRTAALATLKMNLTSQSGIVTGTPSALTLNTTGNWVKTLTLTAATVPCVAVVEFEGLKAERGVVAAPLTMCKK